MSYDPSQTGATTGPETAPPVEANVTTAIPSDTTGPQEANKKPEPKPNRAMRRRAFALARKGKAMEKATTGRRLSNFHLLQDEVERLRAAGKLPTETVDMFFKVALGRLFKKDFKDREFQAKMKAILTNLSTKERSFRYKEELAAIAEANLAKKQQPVPQENSSAGQD